MDFGGAPAKDSIRRGVERVYGFSDGYCGKILNDCLNGVSGDGAVVAKRCYILSKFCQKSVPKLLWTWRGMDGVERRVAGH